MPPGQPPHRDPNVIDVSLRLLGAQSEVAVLALTDQIRMLNEHFAATGTLSAAAQAQGSNRVIQTSTAGRQQAIYEGGPSPSASVNYTGPQGGAQPPVEGGTYRRGTSSGAGDQTTQLHERSFREKLGTLKAAWDISGSPEVRGNPDAPGRLGWMTDLALGMARPPGRIAETPDEREGTGQRMRPLQVPDGRPSDGASMGGPPTAPMPGDSAGAGGASRDGGGDLQQPWQRHVRMQNLEDQMQWPRIGELTTQNKLQMASDWLARNQLQRDDRYGQDTGQWRGRAAGALGIAANNYTQMRVLADNIKSAVSATGVTRAGEQNQAALGYSQQGTFNNVTIPGTNIGGEIPFLGPLFSQAGRESIKRQAHILGLAAQPQISRQQAAEIYNELESRGYSGSERDRLAYQLLGPLTRQGLSPNVSAGIMDEAYRYGNTSITDLRNSLNDLGQVARTTKQSVDQAAEGLGTFANAAAEQGATIQQGLLAGREYVAATGMRPEIAAKLRQNPLFQGLAMQQTGLLPTQQGAMTGTEIATTQTHLANLAMQMSQGFNRPRTETITDAHGRVITRHISGREAQIAQAASFAGMDPESFRQQLRHQNRQSRYTAAEVALRAWSDDVHHSGTMTETGDRASRATAAENALQRGGGLGNHLNWHRVASELIDAGVAPSRVQEIGHQNFRDRIKSAQNELEKSRDPERSGNKQALEVRFTGLAEKWLAGVIKGGDKGHSDTAPWKTMAGIGVDVGKFALSPAAGISKIIGG